MSGLLKLPRFMHRTYLTQALVILDQAVHGLDGEEAILNLQILGTRVQDVGGYDCSEVVDVHLAA